MLSVRASGILLHPTSLPGPFGSGDFGADAYKFIDWLAGAGQTYWQVLPLGEIGPGNSPYMSSSAFAGNILLIDLAELADHGWLIREDLRPHPEFRAERVNYALAHAFRLERLHRAAESFFSERPARMQQDYEKFCAEESQWLDDYALFMTIAECEGWSGWDRWPRELRNREPLAMHRFRQICTGQIRFWKFCQWCFSRQWTRLKRYANERGICIIGDVPIFVAWQSADVWANQKLFELDENGRPLAVAGVPPDYFSETGQLWGNPLYRWDVHRENGFAWWISRMSHALKLADLVRVDHFRGFVAYWAIPADAPNAIDGKWEIGPGEQLFSAIERAFPQMPIIAEDLGLITPEVLALRDQFQLPGMRILQFAFGDGEGNHFLPHHYVINTVAYTGTHDNDTTLGWWSTLPEREKAFAREYLHIGEEEEEGINWVMMEALSGSMASTVIFPMQDVLGLSGEHRMNFPGHPDGNWEWRFSWDSVQPWHGRKLAEMAGKSRRINAGGNVTR